MLIAAAENVYKDYGAQPVLEDINIQIQQGQKIALIGPNGSGKTTLLRILAGRLEPDSGRV